MEMEPYEKAYQQILDLISQRGFRPDSTEVDIAQAIGWNRDLEEMRTDLEMLVERGILVRKKGKYYLPPLQKRDKIRYLELREKLETYFARCLVQRLKES